MQPFVCKCQSTLTGYFTRYPNIIYIIHWQTHSTEYMYNAHVEYSLIKNQVLPFLGAGAEKQLPERDDDETSRKLASECPYM